MQSTVLFVEPKGEILKKLPQLHDYWQSLRVNTAEAALDILEKRNVAVVVANFGMEDEACQEFFSAVSAKASSAIQFVLLADNKANEIDRAQDYAHQSIAAQCQPDEIVKAINTGLSVWQRTQKNPQLASLLKKLNKLPTPPALYFDLRDELDSPNYSTQNVANIIARDQALSARLLKVVNSGFYAVPRSIVDLGQAIGLLGTDIVLGLVLSAHLFDSLPLPGVNLDDLWKHNLMVSALTRTIAKELGADFETINTSGVAGLLHDLGGLVLLSNLPAEYHSLIRQANGDENLLIDLEQKEFGVAHPELGALVMAMWNMPDALVAAVLVHHQAFEQAQSIPEQALLMAEWVVNEFALCKGVYDENLSQGFQSKELIKGLEGWWAMCNELTDPVSA